MRQSVSNNTIALQGFYYGFVARYYASYFCCNQIKPSENR